MKLSKLFLLLGILGVLLLQMQTGTASGTISVEDADAVRNFSLNSASEETLNSTDAPGQETCIDVYVCDADAARDFNLSSASENALNSSDAAPQEAVIDVYVCDADAVRDFGFKVMDNRDPIANAGGPHYGNVNELIQFYGSGTDYDGDAIIGYAWDFDGDGVTDSTLQNPTHSWSVAGTYYPTLKVQDVKGAWSFSSKCTVLIKTPPTYDGAITGVHPQSHYSIEERVNIDVDIKNTGETVETYDIHLMLYDKYDTLVYDSTASDYLSSGFESFVRFPVLALQIGHYSFTAKLNSSSSGSVYDEISGNFRVLDEGALRVIEKAESLKITAFNELNQMVDITAYCIVDSVVGLGWFFVEEIVIDSIKYGFTTDTYTVNDVMIKGVTEQDISEAAVEGSCLLDALGDEIEKYVESFILPKFENWLEEKYTDDTKDSIEARDASFEVFMQDKTVTKQKNIRHIRNYSPLCQSYRTD